MICTNRPKRMGFIKSFWCNKMHKEYHGLMGKTVDDDKTTGMFACHKCGRYLETMVLWTGPQSAKSLAEKEDRA